MQNGRRDNHASQIYLKDDTPMCEPHEANYVQGYHREYHDRNSINSYSYQNRNPNRHYPNFQNRMPHPSQYFNIPKTSTEEMVREWMARQMKANKHMKNQVVELENRINQGLRNRQAIIENLKRKFEYLEKIQPAKSIPHTTNTKSRHEFVYKPPSIRNEKDKDDVKAIEEDKTKPIPTMPNSDLINSNLPTVSPFLEDCTVYIPYTNAKTFADNVLLNHVSGDELNLIDGVGTRKMIKKDDIGLPKKPIKEWKQNEKVVSNNENIYHYLWHPTEIPHLNCIIKES
ncbi:hypothetical protein Tco_0174115 [Tanacetum coccineum]